MDPPLAYQISEVHDAHMIRITTWIGCDVDRPSPPPQEVHIPYPAQSP